MPFLNGTTIVANKYLQEILADIDFENDTFELIFLTFGRLDGQARILSEQLATYPTSIPDLTERCDWHFFDETDLNIELRNALNIQKGISPKTIALYPEGIKGARGLGVIEITSGEYRSFITTLNADQLIRAYEELGKDVLFSLNIRNFIGNTSTNKEIINTAENSPEHFFLFNNGISCLATKVETTTEHLNVSGLQVINGAQTVKALVNLANKKRRGAASLWLNYKPLVLVRITEVPENYGEGSRVREKITQYNNTQNTIKISDFRSNDEVQINLQRQFSEVKRFGKNVQYLAKRTDKLAPNSETIRLEEFSKSVYAFLYNPTEFSGSTSFLFTEDGSGGYSKVFGDGNKKWEKMPQEEFQIRAGSYWIAQEFGTYLKKVRESELDPDKRASLERKWLVIYATSLVFKAAYGDKWKQQVQKLYKGDWRIEDDRRGIILRKLFDFAKTAVMLAYKNSKKNNMSFVHRNWMRGKNTPQEIAEMVDFLSTTFLPIDNIPG